MIRIALILLLLVGGCPNPESRPVPPPGPGNVTVERLERAHFEDSHKRPIGHPRTGEAAHATSAETRRILEDVARIHGAAGPYAVAGYRMGQRALRELGVDHANDDIEVVHASPAQVRWACIADGLQASTGASLGHMNLSRIEAPEANVHSVVRQKSTGREVELRLNTAFIDSLGEMNDETLEALGTRVAEATDEQLFTTVVRERAAQR